CHRAWCHPRRHFFLAPPEALRTWEHMPQPIGVAIITLAHGKASTCQASGHPDAASEIALSFPRRLRYTRRAAGPYSLRTEPGNGLRTSGGVAMTLDEILAKGRVLVWTGDPVSGP